MTRRDFVKMGAMGLAAASVPGIFRGNPLMAFASPPPGEANLKDYYEYFGIDENIIRRVMAAALERGGDYCDVFFEHSTATDVILEDNAVNRAYTQVDYGVGIRVIEDEQTGYSFSEEMTPEAMIKAARTAANIAGESRTAAPASLNYHMIPDYYPIEMFWEDVGIDRKIPLLRRVNEKMLAEDKRVVKARIYFTDRSSHILVATSDGRIACDYRPMTRMFAMCTAEQNGRKEESFKHLGGRRGLEYYTPEKLDGLAGKAVGNTVALFDAVKPEGGEMEVVLASGSSGILLHEAIGHGLEADLNRKNMSIFSEKMNQPVAADFVTIVDDGTMKNYRGSLNVDDEANDTEKTYLVKDGILRSYMHDRISSRHYKVKPTGNGRRQSFRYPPIPRMRNTYMLAGPHTKEEIIKSVKKGLYTEMFTNGEVRIGAGDFTFYVKSGRLIEDGKLTRPVKDVNIIGNGPEVLRDIVMAADDLTVEEGGGTCGKGGQWAPVTDGLPTTKVLSITVGGVTA
ncbi:MAG: TldD/PmbA family protein [Candidatus Zixiibacteriota bacterium]|nr:MAG: TldD/PmbA family protein [candidate division Zixibacteria bacterium]